MKEIDINIGNTPERQTFPFTIFRPNGNDTALIKISSNMPNVTVRKQMNNLLQTMYPNVEQVGYIIANPVKPQLMMAGGEFCGNATRCTIFEALNGSPGKTKIIVSGVNRKLTAGITNTGEAYAEMPIYTDPQKIKKLGEDYIVQMQGITHVVTRSSIEGLSKEEIKKKAKRVIQNYCLENETATGIMYLSNDNGDLKIDPVVFVRDIATLYYETACGSGTTAVGLVLTKLQNESITDVPIKQPSGQSIKISVDFDGQKFTYAEIKGYVEKIGEGIMEIHSATITLKETI